MSGGSAERFPDLAAELVRLQVDVIVAEDNPAIAAAQRATSTIPIVMVLAMDPVRTGFVDSLAQPGGNITGLTVQGTDIQGKALQLLKDAVPTASRVAVLWDATEPGRRVQATEAEVAARALGLEVHLREVRSPAELDSLFTAMVRERVDAVLVHPSQIIGTHRARIAALAAQSRLPTMGVTSGGLRLAISWPTVRGPLIGSSAPRPTSTSSCEGRRRRTCPWSSPCVQLCHQPEDRHDSGPHDPPDAPLPGR